MSKQSITLVSDGKTLTSVVEGSPDIKEAERQRIQREWEKPENKTKLDELIARFGEYTKITDQQSGLAYKVPTRDIITRGIKQEELDKYQLWDNKKDG